MSIIVYLALAAAAAWLAHRWRPLPLPYLEIAIALGALTGAIVLSIPADDLGPRLLQVAIGPAIVGAAAGAWLTRLAARRMAAGAA
jgi:hypothetical protein